MADESIIALAIIVGRPVKRFVDFHCARSDGLLAEGALDPRFECLRDFARLLGRDLETTRRAHGRRQHRRA